MTNKRTQGMFYLLGGIGFIIVAFILFFTSPQRDGLTWLLLAGMILAGLLAIGSYFGLRRSEDEPPASTPRRR